MQLPKIAIVGSGAVGCFFGGLLAKAGFDVSFIARQHQIAALNLQGLTIAWNDHQETLPVKASSNYEILSDIPYVFVAVKTQSTLKTAEEISPFLKSNATVISLQNGLDNIELLKTHIQQNCYAAMVYAAIGMSSPSTVQHFGGGSLVIGNTIPEQAEDRLEPLFQLLKLAKIPTKISKNMLEDLWSKFMINCIFNSLSAIANINYSDLMQSPGIKSLAEKVILECLAIAQHEGIHLNEESIRQKIADVPDHWPKQISSTAQDLLKNKATEIDYLNGKIVEKGKKYQISTPINEMLYTIIKMREFRQGTFNPLDASSNLARPTK